MKKKAKRYTLMLNEVEMRRLKAYAADNGLSRPVALHRIVASTLRAYTPNPQPVYDERQLGLFDTMQIDIFNNTTKVRNDKDS